MKMGESSRRSAIALSLYNNKKSFSSLVDHVVRCTFVSVLIILSEKQKIKLKSLRIDGNTKKQKRIVICKQLFPASSLPVHLGANKKFPAKN